MCRRNDSQIYLFGSPTTDGRHFIVLENSKQLGLEINGHDGTHVNVPLHATAAGKNLDDYDLGTFMGESVLYESDADINPGVGLIFHATDISWDIAESIVAVGPSFIGLPAKFEFDIAIERWLLERDVISFERLINTEQLPKFFYFHGAPLKIVHGDGSPVRAYAVTRCHSLDNPS